MSFRIVRNDITKIKTEAIVNTANSNVLVGAGCDKAIYDAAGFDELLQYRGEKIGVIPEGDAFITPGFKLYAKYIIHAVSPHYTDGNEEEEALLRSCYRRSLQIAKDNGIKSVAFPLISTGSFGYPKEEGMRIAVDEISVFLHVNDMEIYLVVFDENSKKLGEKVYPELEEYIDQNYVEEKRKDEYKNDVAFYSSASKPRLSGRDKFRRLFSGGVGVAGRAEESAPTAKRKKASVPREEQELSASFMMCEAAAEKPAAAEAPKASGEEEAAKPEISAEKIDSDEACFDFEQHESKLEERMKHISDTFSQYLLYIIQEKGMENSEVYKRAIVDKKIFSKIKNNVNYHPQKLTALCLCVGAKLNLDESKDLLARAGYALSPCNKTDIIFSYFIENEIYDMIELDIQLEEHGLPCIIS